ncbi:hypothetical protein M8J77_024135 [Diaphorina citri]|nr:hypothetical protein M8J77_024135 [Diaphorina citri]
MYMKRTAMLRNTTQILVTEGEEEDKQSEDYVFYRPSGSLFEHNFIDKATTKHEHVNEEGGLNTVGYQFTKMKVLWKDPKRHNTFNNIVNEPT